MITEVVHAALRFKSFRRFRRFQEFSLQDSPMTPKPVSRPSGKHTWSAKKEAPRSSHRMFNLLVVSVLFFAAFYWFVSSLWKYDKAPNTYLLHLQIANRDSADVHPLVLVSLDEINAFGKAIGAKEVLDVTPADSSQGNPAIGVAIENAVGKLTELKKNDIVLLYLRGYCVVRNKIPYLVVASYTPSDVNPNNDNQSKEQPGLFDLTELISELEKISAGKVVVMLDHADLDVSNNFQLLEPLEAYALIDSLAASFPKSSTSSGNPKTDVLIISAKDDFQPSHIRFRDGNNPATTLFFSSMQRAIGELHKEHTNPKQGFPFSSFEEPLSRFVTLGSGALQTPVVLARGERLASQNKSTLLTFEFGKPTAKAADASPSGSATAAATPTTPEAPEKIENKTLETFKNHWLQTETLFQPDSKVWPTDFAPFTWQKKIDEFREVEFNWLTTNSSPSFPEVTKWLSGLQGPTTLAPSEFNDAWNQFAKHQFCRAWLFDTPQDELPQECRKYPYVPAAELNFDGTRELARKLARDGNHLSDWLRLASFYPSGDSAETNEFIESVRKHISVLMEADNAWKDLNDKLTTVSVDLKNEIRNKLEQSRKQLFHGTNRTTHLDREIERLKTNTELTVWQLHHRCNLLLRFAQLSTIQRTELLQLCQNSNQQVLPPTNATAPSRSFKDDIEKCSEHVSKFLQGNSGLLRPSSKSDVPCILRPSFDQKLEFVSVTSTMPSTVNPKTLIMQRTITPEKFSIQIQRKDGSAPPDRISLKVTNLTSEEMQIQQAGNKLDWDEEREIVVNDGSIHFEASAQKEDEPALPKILCVTLTDTDGDPPTPTTIERNIVIAWPLHNEFELIATRTGTSQPEINLNEGAPLLGAALLNAEQAPVQLGYELRLWNRSRVSRKALLQFYCVGDPKRGIVVPGSAFNADGEELWDKEELPNKVSAWKKLLPDNVVVDIQADEKTDVSPLIAKALKPTPTDGTTPPANGNAANNENAEIEAPFGLVCELKELDENNQPRGPENTTFIWIKLDTYDPFDPFTSKPSLRCLTQTPPFTIDDDGKLNLELEATDTLRALSGSPKIPVQVEIQSQDSKVLENSKSFSFELSKPYSAELDVTNFKNDPFIAHISFGNFPRQASYVFDNSKDLNPDRKPEVFAQLERIEIRMENTPPATTPPPAAEPTTLLIELPSKSSNLGGRWALLNAKTSELKNAKLVGKINAILPAQQAFVAWRIFNETRDQPQPHSDTYEQAHRNFKVRFEADGILQLKHTIAPLQVEYDVESTFEQEGVYQLEVFADEWTKRDFVTASDLKDRSPIQSEKIIVDRKPPNRASIRVIDLNQKVVSSKLNRNQNYSVRLTFPAEDGDGDLPIKDIKFGIDRNDDQRFQDDEEIKDSKYQIDAQAQEAFFEFKVPMERIIPIRFVARTIDYAGNEQDDNASERFSVGSASEMPDPANPSKTKTYTLTVVVKNTSGSTPSTDVELKMDGRSYNSKEGKNVFIFKNIPGGSYQVTATSNAGTTQYETSEKIDVSGDNSKITREIRLKTKEKSPANQP